MRNHLWIPTALFFAVFVGWLNLDPEAWGPDKMRIFVAGLSAVFIVVGTRIFAPPSARVPWYMLAAAHAAFAVGLLANDLTDNPPPPRASDIFFLGMHPFIWTSLVLFTWDRDRTRDFLGSLDAFLIGMSLGTPTLAFAIHQNIVAPETTTAQSTVYVAYNVVFLIGFVLLLRLLLTAGRWHWPYWVLIFSYGAVFLAELPAAYFEYGTLTYKLLYHLPYSLFFALPAVLAMHPDMSEVQTAGRPYEKWPTPTWRNYLLVVMVVIPIITLSLVEKHPIVNLFVVLVYLGMVLRMQLARAAYALLLEQLRLQIRGGK